MGKFNMNRYLVSVQIAQTETLNVLITSKDKSSAIIEVNKLYHDSFGVFSCKRVDVVIH